MYKVAVCFSGHRGFKHCFSKIKSHYLDQWNIEPHFFYYGPAPGYNLEEIIPNLKYKIEEDNDKNVLPLENFPHSVPPFCWQWYNVKESLYMALNEDKYDAYLRIRSDLYPVGKSTFNWDERNFRPDMLYIPMKLDFGGVCDRFAFGSKDVMEVYANFYGSSTFISGQGNSEARLKTYLEVNNINLCRLLQNYDLDFCHKDDSGVIRYPGPEIEDKLIRLDGEQLTDKSFDRVWWRPLQA